MSHFDQPAFASAIAAVIQAATLTDKDAAQQAGISPSTITRVIRGDNRPDVDTLANLANWAGIPVEPFTVRDQPLPRNSPAGTALAISHALGVLGVAAQDLRGLLARETAGAR